MDSCDVCGATDNLHVCSVCHEAVYCGVKCQSADYEEHQHECMHPSQMTDAEVMDELQLHIEHPDEDYASNHIGASIDNPEDARLHLIGLFNQRKVRRRRVKGTRRRNRRKIRRERRARRGLRRDERSAKRGQREQSRLFRERQKTFGQEQATRGEQDVLRRNQPSF